jgi:predicted RND superfamily exporter protein
MRGSVLLTSVLLALLAGTGVFAYYGLFHSHGTPLGVHGWTAMTIGIVLSLVVGIGLMTLLFYSSRHGHDEGPRLDDTPRKRQR